jgi:hypothetical protein
VNETEIHAAWRTHGFVILPGCLSDTELAPAVSELDMVFPSADGFHGATDPRHERFRNDEFDGIDVFPFASTELSLLAVAPRLVELAERLLGERNLRIYSAEAWAKYTGATNYDQDLHRDYSTTLFWCRRLRGATSSWRCLSSSATFLKSWARRTWFRSDTQPTYRQIRTSTLATAGRDHSWPPTIMLTCTTSSSQEPVQLAPSSRSTSAPSIGEPH